jgi:AsmA protein
MAKILKYLLIALGTLLVLFAGVAAYIAATFDPNAYKPQIIQLVKENRQRTLKLDGDIKLALFPRIGADLGRASLSEHKSDKEFASVESLRLALALGPLLHKELVVDEITVKGIKANVVRSKDGRFNFDDLLSKEEKQPSQFKFDIDHVSVEKSALTYRDEAAGTQFALSDVNIGTGRVANGVPGKLDLSLKVQGNAPKLNLAIQAKGGYLFDLDKKRYAFDALSLEAKGEAAGITNLVAKLTGSLDARLQTGEINAEKLALAVSGVEAGSNMEFKLDAPRLALTQQKASGDKLTITAKITGPKQTLAANAALAGIEGNAQSFKTGGLTLDVDMTQGDLQVKAKVSSPLSGNLQSRQVSLPRLAMNVSAGAPYLPGKLISAELQGSAAVDGAKENAQANLAGKVGESNIKTKLGVQGFAKPAYAFDMDIDQLDLDKYLPPKPAGQAPAAQAAAPAKEEPIDLSALKGLNATGSVRIGQLKARNVKSSQVRVDLKARDGKLDLSPMSANLYQGSLNGAVSLNAAGPAIAAKQNLTGVNISPLLKDLVNYENLEGHGNVALDVTTQGNTVSAMKKALNGTAALNLADGAYRGINIAETIRNAKAALGAVQGKAAPQTQQPNQDQKTDFTELKASFVIRNGVAHNDDLLLKSPLLRVTGAGDVNLGADTVDYTAKATVVATTKGQGGADLGQLAGVTVPVHLVGPLGTPRYQIDFAGLAAGAAKQQIEQKASEQLQKKLPGLFR